MYHNKSFRKLVVGCLSVFLLCSFTNENTSQNLLTPESTITEEGNLDDDEFEQELAKLNPNLDEINILGKDHKRVVNSLDEKDKATISSFISNKGDSLILDDQVYKVLPVNDLGLSPTDYSKTTGHNFSTNGNEVYLTNSNKLSFVTDNIDIMNYMADNDFGYIDSEGMMVLKNDDFAQQSFIMDFHLGWWCMDFAANYQATIFFGAMGLLINLTNLKDINRLMNASKAEFVECFKEVGWDLIQDTSSYWGNLITQNAITAASTVMSVISIAETGTWFGRVCKILQFILSHYLPGFLKGTVMVLSALFYHYGTDVEIGLWWSNYDIVHREVK